MKPRNCFFLYCIKIATSKIRKMAPAFIPAEKFWANDVEETKIIKAKIIFFIISNFKIEILSHFYNIKNLQPFLNSIALGFLPLSPGAELG